MTAWLLFQQDLPLHLKPISAAALLPSDFWILFDIPGGYFDPPHLILG
jgi:hypothetical protein